jgi:hypothetical protein
MGDLRRARELDEQALAMCRRLYGEAADHPEIASGLKSLGIHMAEVDDHERARDLLEQALAMYQRLYGETADHPEIAIIGSLLSLG